MRTPERRSWLLAACLLLLSGGCARPDPTPRRVVLIVVDTLRADHLGLHGYGRATSPALDAAAAEGRVYRRAMSTSSWTLPSFGTILTGTLPGVHGAGGRVPPPPGTPRAMKWARPLSAELPTLPSLLAEQGWATAAFLNNSWLQRHLGVDRGFQVFDAAPASQARNRSAEDTLDAAFRWVDSVEQDPAGPDRWLLVVHFFEPHLGYRPAADARGRFTTGIPTELRYNSIVMGPIRRQLGRLTEHDREFIAAAYDEEILTVDRSIGRLVAGLRERDLWEGSLVMLTADHGEELFEHGGFEHGHTLYQELLHVPLVVWGPGVRRGWEEALVSLEDLAPTILEAAGLAVPPAMTGRSLWANLRSAEPLPARSLVAEGILSGPEQRALLRWPMKLVESVRAPPKLFDLRADPGERHDLAPRSEAMVRGLAQQLQRLSPGSKSGEAGEAVELPPEMVEQLRSLGYVQ